MSSPRSPVRYKCGAKTTSGSPCKNTVSTRGDKCYLHEEAGPAPRMSPSKSSKSSSSRSTSKSSRSSKSKSSRSSKSKSPVSSKSRSPASSKSKSPRSSKSKSPRSSKSKSPRSSKSKSPRSSKSKSPRSSSQYSFVFSLGSGSGSSPNAPSPRRPVTPRKSPAPKYSPRKSPAPKYSPRKSPAPKYSPRKSPAPKYSPGKTPAYPIDEPYQLLIRIYNESQKIQLDLSQASPGIDELIFYLIKHPELIDSGIHRISIERVEPYPVLKLFYTFNPNAPHIVNAIIDEPWLEQEILDRAREQGNEGFHLRITRKALLDILNALENEKVIRYLARTLSWKELRAEYEARDRKAYLAKLERKLNRWG